MSKKYIDIMDTTFRDGFQSVFGGRVLMNDFFPAVEAAKDAGIYCIGYKSKNSKNQNYSLADQIIENFSEIRF